MSCSVEKLPSNSHRLNSPSGALNMSANNPLRSKISDVFASEDDFDVASQIDSERRGSFDVRGDEGDDSSSNEDEEIEFVSTARTPLVGSPLVASPSTRKPGAFAQPCKCTTCDAVIQVQSRFCHMCGALLGAASRSQTPQTPRLSSASSTCKNPNRQETTSEEGGVSRTKVRFQRKNVLGRGSSGLVFGCIETTTGQPLACKEMAIPADDDAQLLQVRKEIKHLSCVRHPNVIEYYGVSVKRNKFQITVQVLMERLSCGTLLAALTAFPGGMPESVVQQYMYQLLCAVDYIHSMSITHRDIKPGNVLLTNEGVVKLTDFGTAMAGSNFDHVAGTPGYMPPEALTGSKDKANAFERAKAHDIWSLGCTAYHLLTGRAPWAHTNLQDFPLAAYIHRAQCFEYEVALPEGPIKHLIERCLVPTWDQRPSAKTMLTALLITLPDTD